jgi:methylmalonyl-CoA mutase C-terminal domain/subunit
MQTTVQKRIRVLVAKPGLDGHDRGAKVVARALRDAGFEVIYTGIRRTPEEIAETAMQEDVDVVGLSILSGAHLELTPLVVEELKKRGIEPNKDLLLLMGGIIPEEDVEKLRQMGVAMVFGPGTPLDEIIEFIRKNVPKLKKGGVKA